MSLPNMKNAVLRWAKTLTIRNVTITTVDFEPTEVVVSRDVKATVQPAQKRRLNPDKIDWSLKYVQVHSSEPVVLGEFFTHQGIEYKIIDDGDYQRYGYTDAVGEEVKK